MYVTSIVLMNALLGVVFAPSRTLAALRGSSSGGSLFSLDVEYASLLDKTVGELRALLEIPERGIAHHPRELHAHAPRPG
jgi:hypothetical protein